MDKKITDSIIYIGVDDKDIDLFESQYVVPNGVSYRQMKEALVSSCVTKLEITCGFCHEASFNIFDVGHDILVSITADENIMTSHFLCATINSKIIFQIRHHSIFPCVIN